MVRQRVWSRRMGFPARALPEGSVTPAARPAIPAPALATPGPASTVVGLIAAGPGGAEALAAAAGLYGVELNRASIEDGGELLARAVRETWPVVGIAMEDTAARAGSWCPLLCAYLGGGGTVLLHGMGGSGGASLAALAAGLEIELPAWRDVAAARGAVTFEAGHSGFASVFAGARIDGVRAGGHFDGAGGGRTLASIDGGGGPAPAVVEIAAHGGRLVLAGGAARFDGRLADAIGPEGALTVLPPMMLVRQLYGLSAWHAPVALANFTVDDPVLNPGVLGLDYERVARLADAHDFHLTVATVPRELPLADPRTVELLASRPERVSACYHGNDHDGYEFYMSSDRRVRFRGRPLAAQERAVSQAARRGRAFAERTGHQLDRVMVFPHGLCPGDLLPRLGEAGFLATSNWLDRHPLLAAMPGDPDLGTRPADVAWSGFPLLWRRDLADRTFAFDLFLGRPVTVFAHRRDLGTDLEPFVRRAEEINRAGGGEVRWRGLEQVAQHAYLWRRTPGPGERWRVMMTANEACLHNPGTEPRELTVSRPHLPPGALLEADGAHGSDTLQVVVPPGATTLVKLRHADGRELPSSGRCLVPVSS